MPIPIVLAYVRLTGVGGSLDDLEGLRDAIATVVSQHADRWAVRITRRVVSPKEGVELMTRYEARVALKRRERRIRS